MAPHARSQLTCSPAFALRSTSQPWAVSQALSSGLAAKGRTGPVPRDCQAPGGHGSDGWRIRCGEGTEGTPAPPPGEVLELRPQAGRGPWRQRGGRRATCGRSRVSVAPSTCGHARLPSFLGHSLHLFGSFHCPWRPLHVPSLRSISSSGFQPGGKPPPLLNFCSHKHLWHKIKCLKKLLHLDFFLLETTWA